MICHTNMVSMLLEQITNTDRILVVIRILGLLRFGECRRKTIESKLNISNTSLKSFFNNKMLCETSDNKN